MRSQIIDELRPTDPEIDPTWEVETMRSILENGGRETSIATRPVWQGRVAGLVLVAATIAVIVGGLVVARQHLPADDIRPAKPVQKTVQTIDPSEATVLKLGDTLDVVTELPKTFADEPVSFSGFTDDGMLLGVVRPQPADPGSGELEQAFPVLYDLDAETFTILDDRVRPETTQIARASGDASTVVWAEVVGTMIDHSTFTIYAYDRASKKVTTLGDFDDPDGQIVYGNDLVMAGGTAYFSMPTYPGKAGQEAVYSVPVDGSTPPEVLVAGAAMVTLSGDKLTYGVRDPKDQGAYPTLFTYDVTTGKTAREPVSEHLDEPGFCGAEFSEKWETWCVGQEYNDDSSEPAMLTIKETSGRTTEFEPFPIDSYNVPAPHDLITLGPWTAITVTTDDGQDRKFLVDLDTKQMKVFPDNTSFTALSPDRSTALISSYAGKGP